MSSSLIIGELISEAYVRASSSFSRSMELYHARLRLGLQPSSYIINFFNVEQQFMWVLSLNAIYIIVTIALFLHMKKKQIPYRLRWILVMYDSINVILSGYIFYSTILYKFQNGILICNPISNDIEGRRIGFIFLLFYLQKYFEFFDTWFFILRKSFRQVTFLHLFHHSSITVVVGTILPFDYNGDMYLPILLNSGNHMLVYLHYLFATLGIQSQWSSYLTSLQFIQFSLIFAQSFLSYRIGPTCGSPDFAKLLMIVYMGSMIILFLNFFLQKYVFQKPFSALDLCGVVKRPRFISNTKTVISGIATLNSDGEATIVLPVEFPDAQRMAAHSLRFTPFVVTYQLTPLLNPMPNIHVSSQVGCYRIPKSKVDENRKSYHISERIAEGKRDTNLDGLNTCKNVRHRKNKVIAKSVSFSTFKNLHNDRLIDGPIDPFSVVQTLRFQDFQNNQRSENVNINSSQSHSETRVSYHDLNNIFDDSLLCFDIAGGYPNGSVSWTISTVPILEKHLSTVSTHIDWRALT